MKCNNCNRKISKKYYKYKTAEYCGICYEFYLDAISQLNKCPEQQPKLKNRFKEVKI